MSPTPSLAYGTEIAVAGLQTVAALAFWWAMPMAAATMTTRTAIVSEKRLTFIFFLLIE
jgi:hypothetical protein